MRAVLLILHDVAAWGLRATVPVAAWGMWAEWTGHADAVDGQPCGHVAVAVRGVRDRGTHLWRGTYRRGWRAVAVVRAYLAGARPGYRARRYAVDGGVGRWSVRGCHRSGGVTVRQVRMSLVGEAVRLLADQRAVTVASLRWARRVVLA